MPKLKRFLSYIVCIAISGLIAFNVAISMFAPKYEFGSPFEADNYCENFSGVLYVMPTYIEERISVYPCIATVSRNGDEYCVEQVCVVGVGWLSCYSYIDGPIKPDKNYDIEIDTDRFQLRLGNLATEADYAVLNASQKRQGKYCASVNSGVYHYSVDGLPDCTHARKIAEKNMVFFNSTKEAEFFGYNSFCDECMRRPRYDEDFSW